MKDNQHDQKVHSNQHGQQNQSNQGNSQHTQKTQPHIESNDEKIKKQNEYEVEQPNKEEKGKSHIGNPVAKEELKKVAHNDSSIEQKKAQPEHQVTNQQEQNVITNDKDMKSPRNY